MQKLIKKYRKAKGFTLVELLIVIIIIGILAGMMMLSTGAATDKAEATKVLSNLRNIKAATIMYYADNNKWPGDMELGTDAAASIDNYLDSSVTGASYDIVSGDGKPYKVSIKASGLTTGVAEKLTQISDALSVDTTNGTATMNIK